VHQPPVGTNEDLFIYIYIYIYGSVRLIASLILYKRNLNYGRKQNWLRAGLWDLYMTHFGQWVHFELVLGWARTVLDCFWAQVAAHVFTTPALWPSLQASLCEFPASFSQALTNA
jgi:hypothetical protein